MTKPRPKTGEKREVKRPLNIDRLPVEVKDAILQLRDQGKTWPEIEELSALPKDKGGFIDWEALPTPVLELFPDLRLPHSNLHRWYDLRVSQVVAETMARSAQAREIAAAFAKSIVKGEDEAVVNAARDQLMAILAEDSTGKGRLNATKGLIALADIMNERRLNDIKERKVAVDERRIKALEAREALTRKKLEAETDKAASKLKKGELTVEDINRLRERVFGLPPVEATSHA
jgi:hypothetical protein